MEKASVLPSGVALRTFHNAPTVSVLITGQFGVQFAEQMSESPVTVLRMDRVREETLCKNGHKTYHQIDIGAKQLDCG